MNAPTMGPASRTYFSQRLRLHYADWGNEGAPPLLLIHGGRDHCRNWDWVAQDLRGDYHIIAPDLRGHGDSQWMLGGNYSMVDYVADIAQLVHQKQEAPITIIGHSLGGSIALQYAGVYPDNVVKVVSIEGLGPSPAQISQRGTPGPGERMQVWIEALREFAGRTPRHYHSIEQAVKRMQQANPHLSP